MSLFHRYTSISPSFSLSLSSLVCVTHSGPWTIAKFYMDSKCTKEVGSVSYNLACITTAPASVGSHGSSQIPFCMGLGDNGVLFYNITQWQNPNCTGTPYLNQQEKLPTACSLSTNGQQYVTHSCSSNADTFGIVVINEFSRPQLPGKSHHHHSGCWLYLFGTCGMSPPWHR